MCHHKKKALLSWLLLCCLALSSCAGGIPLHEEEATPSLTLPPAPSDLVAPIGDAALEYATEASLFLPRHGGSSLLSIIETVVFTPAKPRAESLVRALLNHEGNGQVSSIGGDVLLALHSANPVEVSRDVATVNLSASALQLDRKAFFLACQAITNTLTQLPEIHYVNVLVMGQEIGLDIGGTLPMGVLSRSIGDDAGALYEQLLSRRVDISQSLSSRGLTASAALYFPLAQVDGIMPEVRSVSFPSQDPEDMALRLLEELAAGPQQVIHSPALSLLSDLLTETPHITTSSQGGGKTLTLRFAYNFDDMLSAFGLSRASCMASLCYTLTGFLPGVTSLRCYVGEELVEHVLLRRDPSNQVALIFDEALQHRADYAAFLLDMGTLFFADASGQKLVQVQRPMPYFQVHHPRALLLELAKGPMPFDTVPGRPIMKEGALTDADLVGFSMNGFTLLVNLSPTFAKVGQGFPPEQDRLLAYGIVNTISSLARIRKVRFFVAGEAPADFSGSIYWSGDFYKNTGLIK